jgi:hypothetical protein
MTINIIRPEVTNNYTILPNILFELGRHYPEIKPRDIGVLNYMFTKPEIWQPRTKDLAKAMNVSEWGVRQSLTRLIKLGFASYTRNNLGYTQWCISVPESLLPLVNSPRVEIPHEGNHSVLKNNEKTIITKNTTTRCVNEGDFSNSNTPVDCINEQIITPVEFVTEPVAVAPEIIIEEAAKVEVPVNEPVAVIPEPEIIDVPAQIETVTESPVVELEVVTEPTIAPVAIIEEIAPIAEVITVQPEIELPEQLTEVEKLAAKKTITKADLDTTTYAVIMLALKTALTSGGVRSPIAYLNGLINKAKEGTLDASNYNRLQASKCQLNRSDEIKNLFAKHGEPILLELVTNGVIHTNSLGLIQYDEAKKLGLVNETWAKKYADSQLQKMTKSMITKPAVTPIKKQSKPMSEADFEAKRQTQIEMAMAILNQGNQ